MMAGSEKCLSCGSRDLYGFGLCYECWEQNYRRAVRRDAIEARLSQKRPGRDSELDFGPEVYFL